MSEDFEEYWRHHRDELLANAPKSLRDERAASTKMTTGGDWLLAIVPVIVMSGFLSLGIIKSELLNFLAAAVIGIVVYGLTIYVRPFVTGKRNVVDIDADIKEYYRSKYDGK